MSLNQSQSHRNRPYPLVTETGEGSGMPRLTRKPRLYAHWFVDESGKLTCRWETAR